MPVIGYNFINQYKEKFENDFGLKKATIFLILSILKAVL